MKFSGQKVLVYFSILMVVFLLGFLFRHNILLGIAQLLIKEDSHVLIDEEKESYLLAQEENPRKVDAIFVLGGASGERAPLAAKLFHKGYAEMIITTGEQVPTVLEVLDTALTEAQLTRQALLNANVDSQAIITLNQGTSTYEEAEIILGYAEASNYKRIILVSSKFHTRRVQGVFRKKFEAAGIKVFILGADPLRYEISNWWNSEEALIFVNNEYIKHLYYAWKYR